MGRKRAGGDLAGKVDAGREKVRNPVTITGWKKDGILRDRREVEPCGRGMKGKSSCRV